jgi:hypothetical protein
VGAVATRSSRQPKRFEILRAPEYFHHWTIHQTLFRTRDGHQRQEEARLITERATRLGGAALELSQIEIPRTVELHAALAQFGAFNNVALGISPFWPLDVLPYIISDLVDKSHPVAGMLMFPVIEFFARCAPLVAIDEATERSIRQRNRRSRAAGVAGVAMPDVACVKFLRALRSARIDWEDEDNSGPYGSPGASKVLAAVDSSELELGNMVWDRTKIVRSEILSALQSLAKECPGCFDLMVGQAVACSPGCAAAVRQRRHVERSGPRLRPLG